MFKRGQLVEWIHAGPVDRCALGIIEEDEKANTSGKSKVLVYWLDYKESSRELSEYIRPAEKKEK
jgi:hypothetical protein